MMVGFIWHEKSRKASKRSMERGGRGEGKRKNQIADGLKAKLADIMSFSKVLSLKGGRPDRRM